MRLRFSLSALLLLLGAAWGCQSPVATRVQRLVPNAPTGVVGVAGNAEVLLAWNAPEFPGSAPISKYTITTMPGGATQTTDGARTLLITGLENGQSYTFTVYATNEVGDGPNSLPSEPLTPMPPITVPQPPTNVLAVPGDAQAIVYWSAPKDTGGSPLISYTVSCVEEDLKVTTLEPVAFISGLKNGTAYSFTVHATNVAGDSVESLPSNQVVPSTLPGAPFAVVAQAGDRQVTISWEAPANDGGSSITDYLVQGVPGDLTFQAQGATSATFDGLTNGTTYFFTVFAINANGIGPGASADPATPTRLPDGPTLVIATAGDGSATVTWTAPSTDGGSPITGYEVKTLPDGTMQEVTGNILFITGLTNGATYTFQVAAITAVGSSPWSELSNAVTPSTRPGAPLSVTATGGDGQATLIWSAPADEGGSAVTDYLVVTNPGGTTSSTHGATTATLTGLSNGTPYVFTVYAINANGMGPGASSNVVTPRGLPDAPTLVTATAGNAEATVRWAAPANDGGSPILHYTLKQLPGGTTTEVHGTMAVVASLSNGSEYRFQVAATNAVGIGPWSVVSDPVTPATFPGAPTGVSATAGDASAVVSWSPPASSGGSALLDYTITAWPSALTMTVAASVTQATFSGLTNGTEYTFTAHARNSRGPGPESAPSTGVTPMLIPSATQSTFTASPSTLLADGRTKTTLTATIRNAIGIPIPGRLVVLRASGTANMLTPTSGKTDANGRFVATFSSLLPGPRVVTATSDPLSLVATVVFTSATCTTTPNLVGTAITTVPNTAVTGADVNGDGFLDVATSNPGANSVSILLGNGNGTFNGPTSYKTFNDATFTTIGDFDNDGKLDLATTSNTNGTVNVFPGLGNGTFAAPSSFPSGTMSGEIRAADFNNDGLLDVVVLPISNVVNVLLGNGNGTFRAPLSSPIGVGHIRVDIGDFDNDGRMDFAAVDNGGKSMSVLLGKGDGTFRPTVRYGPLPANVAAIAAADFDGNGTLDLAVAESSSNVDVFLGVGDGTFGPSARFPSSAASPNTMRSADLNGDGRPDLIVADLWTNRVTWLEGKGDGTFKSPVIYVETSSSTVAADIVVGDFTGDGRLDLVISNTSAGKVTLMKNNCSP